MLCKVLWHNYLGASRFVFIKKFTGKELDRDGQIDWDGDGADDPGEQGLDLSYFGARYYDMETVTWVSIDPKEQFASPYLYVGNRFNALISLDPDGNKVHLSKAFQQNKGLMNAWKAYIGTKIGEDVFNILNQDGFNVYLVVDNTIEEFGYTKRVEDQPGDYRIKINANLHNKQVYSRLKQDTDGSIDLVPYTKHENRVHTLLDETIHAKNDVLFDQGLLPDRKTIQQDHFERDLKAAPLIDKQLRE